MMPSARLPLTAYRNDPFWATIVITGIDLAGAVMALAVRQYPDQPGAPLISVASGASPGAQGLRLVTVEIDDDGIPQSFVEIIINKATIQSLSAAPEIGDDVEFYYDLQVTPAPDPTTIWTDNIEQTWTYGPFIVKGSANA